MGTLAGGQKHGKSQTAYCEGYHHGAGGGDVGDNPHAATDVEAFQAWDDGFDDEAAGVSAPRCNVIAGTAPRDTPT